MTCIVRFFIVLLCLALTYTASASASKGAASAIGCHEAAHASTSQLSADRVVAASPHDVHAMRAETHLQHHTSSEYAHADCDCAQKCGCASHCVISSLVTQSLWCALTPSLPAFVAADMAIDVPGAGISSPFRPPIPTFS